MSITARWAIRPTDSSVSLAEWPSGSSSCATPSETNAPDSYGKLPALMAAPRYRNIVQTTLKIMNRISQAPPRCEPLNRERRSSRAGELRSRITANVTMPASASVAMRSCRNPSSGQCPINGMAKSSSNNAP